MTNAQLKAWQRHVLDARRRVEQFQVAGYPTGVPEDAAILAADQELTASRAIVQAAREYVRATEYAYAVSATRYTEADEVQAASDATDDYEALKAAVGEVKG